MEYRGLTLDRFQEDACKAIDKNQSVLVSAPTGCGKTIVAEYAVDVSMQKEKRVIYTAPIKALSNQKYRDFKKRFGDENVGIHTGDLSVNPAAPILIMTTEIFRNMILEQSHRLEDVLYTIFDEVHFIDDEDRGTVWEESIILAPDHIRFVSLSATVPNIDDLADWINEVRHSETVVIKENNRPVPLKNHLFSAKYGPVSFKLLQSKYLKNPKQRKKLRFRKPSARRIIKHILREEGTPILYFTFNRKGCESSAYQHAELNLLSREEEERLQTMVTDLVNKYQLQDYEKLDSLKSLWHRGVAFHHAGILPAAKEIVERLFATGLIKLLFCTETFALGVNMPARTVVFDDLEKFNGVEFMYMPNRSFQQMAGRAGRRGMDDIGHVYCHVMPETTDPNEVKRLFYEESEPVRSRFNASYSTILSLYSRYGEDAYPIFQKSLRNYRRGNFVLSRDYKREEEQIRARVLFLKSNGYLDGQELTEKGKLAMAVSGYEIQAAELYKSRCFDELSPEKVVVVLAGLITESRKKNQIDAEFVFHTDAPKIIKKVRRKEDKAGVKDPIRELDLSLSAPIYAWASGCDLTRLASFGVPEGDLIRILRMVLQLLRSIKLSIDDPVTIEKLNSAMKLINRDAVDAEAELRIESSL